MSLVNPTMLFICSLVGGISNWLEIDCITIFVLLVYSIWILISILACWLSNNGILLSLILFIVVTITLVMFKLLSFIIAVFLILVALFLVFYQPMEGEHS